MKPHLKSRANSRPKIGRWLRSALNLALLPLAFASGYHFGRSSIVLDTCVPTMTSRSDEILSSAGASQSHRGASSNSVVNPQSAPKSVAEARANLGKALTQAWDLGAEEELFTNARGGVSISRFMLNKFVQEVAKQVTVGPVCLDWDARYVLNFGGCNRIINYQHSDTERIFKHPKKGKEESNWGSIQGDLGEDMSHVPAEILDFAVVTQVFEHVPHFWNALPNLARMMKQKSILLFSVPWAYQFHPMPGDFYRYSPQAVFHLLESSGFAVCHFVSDGWRTLQMHALGLEMPDIHNNETYMLNQPLYSLLVGASNYNVLAQRVPNIGDPCSIGPKLELTNELSRNQFKEKTYGWWPRKMRNFPFSTFSKTT